MYSELPKSVAWEVTRKCNFDCMHCYNNSGLLGQDELPLDKCYKLIDKVHALDSIKTFVVGGGEPLMHGNIDEITIYIKERFERIILLTNGSLVPYTDKNILKAYDEIVISAYGLEGLDRLFKKVKQTNLVEATKRLKKLNISFSISTVLTCLNKNEIIPLYSLAKQLGAQYFKVQEFIPRGRGLENLDLLLLPLEENLSIKNTLREIDNESFIDFAGYAGCGGGAYFLEIDYAGNISPCAFLPFKINLFDVDLAQALKSDIFEDFRKFKQGKTYCPLFYGKYFK